MTEPLPSAADTALERSRKAAAKLGAAEWQVDAEPWPESEDEPAEVAPPAPKIEAEPPRRLLPATLPDAVVPPPPIAIFEALLFVGGAPLTPAALGGVLRGVTAEQIADWIETLNRLYRKQNRPYSIQHRDQGWVMALKPAYRDIRDKLYGGPREARLSPAALDVLSLIAYRRPIAKAELDALQGSDCTTALRQLVRLGFVAETSRAQGGQAAYGPTARFLEHFGLASLDDLPQLGEMKQVVGSDDELNQAVP